MQAMEIIDYNQSYETVWDDFCVGAANASFLHTRRFLNYHGNRFKDLSVLIMESGKVVGVFPAAESLSNFELVVSHPGITYGGLIHQGWLIGARMIQALTVLSEYYMNKGYRSLHYKAIPYIYTTMPAQDDLYALFRLGAHLIRCDLSSTVELANRPALSKRRRQELKKAHGAVTLSSDFNLLSDLWAVIAQNLARKHDAKPVHSLAELGLLKKLFPEQIIIQCALMDGRVEAGVIFFNSSTVWHAQYVAASEKAYEVSALEAVIDSVIVQAQQVGARYFDLGTSNEEDGVVLNEGLHRFKAKFGSSGVAHQFYELKFDHTPEIQ